MEARAQTTSPHTGGVAGVTRKRPHIRKIETEERLRSEMMSMLEAALVRQSATVRSSPWKSDPREENVFPRPLGLFDPPPPWAEAQRDSELPTLRVARYEVEPLATSPPSSSAADPAKDRETLPAPAAVAPRKTSRRAWLFGLALAAILGTGLAVDPQARDGVEAVARSAAARLWAALY
jgi:hypothetical protein